MTIACNVPGLPFTLSPSPEVAWAIDEATATVTAAAAARTDMFIDPAEVVEVGPRPISPDSLPCRLRVGQGLVANRNPQPVQDPPVPGVASKTAGVAFTAQRRDLSQ